MALMRLPSGTTVSSAYMKLLLGAGVFLLLASELFPQETKAAPQCAAVTLRISLKAGDTFQRRINGLTFRVRATKDAGSCYGWRFFLEDAAGHDFIYPVNPPLRFNPSQLLGCGYGESAQQLLKWDRELRFLLDQADYEHFDPLVEKALWPYNAPNPAHAAEDYLTALAKLRTGLLRLKILSSDVAPDGAVRSAELEVELIAPSDFHFDSSLKPRSTACPHQSPPP